MEYTEQGPRYRPCEIFGVDIEHQMVWRTVAANDRMRLDRGDHCEACGFMVLSYHIHRTVEALKKLDDYEASQRGSIY